MAVSTLQVVLFLSAAATAGAQPWDMDRCLSYALSHNPEIAIQENISRQYKSRFVAECLNVLPTFNASVTDDFTTFSVSGDMLLFQGFSRQHQRQMARTEYDISILDILNIKEDLTIRTIESFLQFAQAWQQLDFAKAGYEASLNEREKTRLLVGGGTQPMSALLQVEAQLASDRSAMVEAECAVKSRRLELCQTLDIPYDKDFTIDPGDISDSLVPPRPYSPQLLEAIARNSPRYLKSLSTVKHRRASYLRSLSALSPALSLRASHTVSTLTTPVTSDKSIGLCLTLPFLTSWHYGPQISEARLEKKRAELETSATLRNLQTSIESAFIESGNSYSKSQAALENVKALGESLRINRLKYEQGMITATDYTLAKSEYEKARSAFLKAKWQHIFQLKIIDWYVSEYAQGVE